MDMPVVSLKKVCDINNYEAIREGVVNLLDSVQHKITIPRDATIMIKVNLCLLMGPETGATVDPRVARAVVEWLRLRHSPRQIIIAEADATHLSADMAFKALGWKKFFGEWDADVELLNLSCDKRISVKTCYGNEIEMSERYMNADILISLAKLKTHSLQKITCTMKNLFGSLPEKYKIKYHPRLTEAICEFASARPPDISLIDGIVGMDGKGPVNGVPKVCEVLIAGTDMVATDIYCTKLMGFKPSSVPHLAEALKQRLGSKEYEMIGDAGQDACLNFEFMPRWEEAFRNVIKSIRQKKETKAASNAGCDRNEV